MESVRWLRRMSLGLGVGILPALLAASAPAWAIPDGPPEPAAAAQPAKPAPAKPKPAPVAAKPQPAAKPVAAVKPAPAKPAAVTRGDAEAAPGWEPPSRPAQPPAPKKSAGLKLAPSAAEIESERKQNGTPEGGTPARDPRDVTPNQDQRFPTHVDYTRGPGSSLGGGTAGDRKATVQDASGPQTGVVRNHW